MSARKLTEILLAIVAVWQLLEAAPVMTYLLIATVSGLPGVSEEAARFSFATVTAQLVVSIAVNTAILIWRVRIAEWLAPGRESVSGEVHEWQTAALAVVGAYFVVRGVSGAVGEFIGRPIDMTSPSWDSIGSEVIQAVLGTGLFLGAPGLSRLWHRLRTAGVGGGAA